MTWHTRRLEVIWGGGGGQVQISIDWRTSKDLQEIYRLIGNDGLPAPPNGAAHAPDPPAPLKSESPKRPRRAPRPAPVEQPGQLVCPLDHKTFRYRSWLNRHLEGHRRARGLARSGEDSAPAASRRSLSTPGSGSPSARSTALVSDSPDREARIHAEVFG